MAAKLTQRYLNTGEQMQSKIEQVPGTLLSVISPTVEIAADRGDVQDLLRTGWYLSADVDGDKLKCRLFHCRPSGPQDVAAVRFEVFRCGGLNLCEVRLYPSAMDLPYKRLVEADDIQRAVAWAWLRKTSK